MFKIIKNYIYTIDEVVDDMSACLFFANKLNLNIVYVKSIRLYKNLYISVFRLSYFNYYEFNVLKICINDYFKPSILCNLCLSIYSFFDSLKYQRANFICEGMVLIDCVLFNKIYIAECFNANYSMALKCFKQNKLYVIPYKHYNDINDTFMLGVFITHKNIDKDLLIKTVIDLKNTFLILNKEEEWNNVNNFIKENYHGKETNA